MNWTDWFKAALALCVWREARGESFDGKRAVGHVIRNRVNAGQGDWIAVITAKNQFSSISHPGDPQLVLYPQVNSETFPEIMKLVSAIFDGTDLDNTSGSLFYANLATMDQNGWFQRNIVDKPAEHPQLAVIGAHTFYK